MRSVPGKLYAKIIEKGLREKIDQTIDKAQCGFRIQSGTHDLIFAIDNYGKEL